MILFLAFTKIQPDGPHKYHANKNYTKEKYCKFKIEKPLEEGMMLGINNILFHSSIYITDKKHGIQSDHLIIFC